MNRHSFSPPETYISLRLVDSDGDKNGGRERPANVWNDYRRDEGKTERCRTGFVSSVSRKVLDSVWCNVELSLWRSSSEKLV